MAVRYPGPYDAVDVAGQTVALGEVATFPAATERQLVAQGWEPVKSRTSKPDTKEA